MTPRVGGALHGDWGRAAVLLVVLLAAVGLAAPALWRWLTQD